MDQTALALVTWNDVLEYLETCTTATGERVAPRSCGGCGGCGVPPPPPTRVKVRNLLPTP